MGCSRSSWMDLLFSLFGVSAFLLDWSCDAWLAAEFYRRGELLWFGLLLALLGLSSMLVQMFSWLWFQYDRRLRGDDDVGGKGRSFWMLCLLHVLQLGFLCRHVSAVRQCFRVWWHKDGGSEYAAYLTHDLSMLRLIETFSESAPQLILMLHVLLSSDSAHSAQLVGVAASVVSVSWMLVDFHRSLRFFVPGKAAQSLGSSLVYFLWNLLLIGPRVAALALFGRALPLLAAAHFLLLWPALAWWAWLQGTAFMESAAGEGLYRATLALIWYFSWFNAAEGRSRGRSLVYHGFMVADGALLMGAWWEFGERTKTQGTALLVAVPTAYALGLVAKATYYARFHPRLAGGDGVDVRDFAVQENEQSATTLINRRMAKQAAMFYHRD